MDVGGGAGLLGSCWLVVPVMALVVTTPPDSVTSVIDLEGIPVPISFARACELSLELKGTPVVQSRAA